MFDVHSLAILGTRLRTGLRPCTTRTPEHSGVVPRSMAHMATLEVGLPTTREQEHVLAGALSMGHTDLAGLHKHGIHAQEPMRKLVRDQKSTERVMSSEMTTGPRPLTQPTSRLWRISGWWFRTKVKRTSREERFTPAELNHSE